MWIAFFEKLDQRLLSLYNDSEMALEDKSNRTQIFTRQPNEEMYIIAIKVLHKRSCPAYYNHSPCSPLTWFRKRII